MALLLSNFLYHFLFTESDLKYSKQGEGMGMNEEEDEALVEKVKSLDEEIKAKLTEQGIAFETEEDAMEDEDEDGDD